MLFRRRIPLSLLERLRAGLWPRKGPLRPLRYILFRVLRLKATPHAIAAGVAAGAAASCTPFLGFHFVIAFCIAYVLRGNMVAAALGTAFGNPVTFPFIFAGAYRIGIYLLGREHSDAMNNIDFFSLLRNFDVARLWQPIVKPLLIGGLPLAVLFGLIFYAVTRHGVRFFRKQRK